ncbi:Swt1 family HEPN domain-containing protein, partial [Novosphingobium resinovorum]|uniref:Swt1 family HEPN domain-containing protein n=1 Tax=Novosphingobium resinovorum TaxID=158500 RepID=UPI0022A8E0C2
MEASPQGPAPIPRSRPSTLLASRLGNSGTRSFLQLKSIRRIEEPKENAQKNVDREASEGLPPRSNRLIEYTTFGELNDIVKENWNSFSGIFSSVSKNRVLRVLVRLNHARGPIAHCNFLPEEEAVRMKLAIRDWYKLME